MNMNRHIRSAVQQLTWLSVSLIFMLAAVSSEAREGEIGADPESPGEDEPGLEEMVVTGTRGRQQSYGQGPTGDG